MSKESIPVGEKEAIKSNPPTIDTETVGIPKEVLGKLSSLQDALNQFIDKDWISKRSCADWSLAITLECAELIDSYPWKWWKSVHREPDLKNVCIELVDILHFSLSGMIQVDALAGRTDTTENGPNTDEAKNGEKNLLLDRVHHPLSNTQNAIRTFRQLIRDADHNLFDIVTSTVIQAASDLSFNLVAYYLAKHTLNHVRQLGGYKASKYRKVDSAGREDNELLHDCIRDLGPCTTEFLQNFDSKANCILSRVYDVFDTPQEQRQTVERWLWKKGN